MSNVVVKNGDVIAEVNAGGTLICANITKNWSTIGEWTTAFTDIEIDLKVIQDRIYISLSQEPSYRIFSLLEHFDYQP